MRIGINEVLLYARSSGTRQRELNIMPQLLRKIDARNYAEAIVYVANDLDDEIMDRLIGGALNQEVIRTPLVAVPSYKRIIGGVFYWPSRIARDQLDLFHTAYFPAPKVSIPVVLTVNDVRFKHYPETYRPLRRFFLELFVPRSLNAASRIIAISRDTKKDLIQFFGIPEDKIDVIYIPADPRFRPVTAQKRLSAVRAKYRLPEKFLLFVGHLEPRKNLVRLVKAFTLARSSKLIDHDLVILGKPSFGFQPILETVSRSGLGDSIIFTGYVEDEDMPAVYSLADVVTFPSLHEGFGMPVLEAMGCGTPVLTSNGSALPEVADGAAILVDPYSVDSIAQGIANVLTDHDLHRELAKKGLKRVQSFNREKAAAEYLDVYKKTLGTQ